MKRWIVVALLCASTVAGAQTSAAKKELVAKVLQLQQPLVMTIATQMAQQPAAQLMQGASIALQQRIPPDKRQAVAKEIQDDFTKYSNEVVPAVRERAVKLAPTSIGAVLEEKFTEDELKQLIALLESPINRKLGTVLPEMQRSLVEKLAPEAKTIVEPKFRELDRTIAARLGIKPPEGAAAPAQPASR